jgi:hypothetical protein
MAHLPPRFDPLLLHSHVHVDVCHHTGLYHPLAYVQVQPLLLLLLLLG